MRPADMMLQYEYGAKSNTDKKETPVTAGDQSRFHYSVLHKIYSTIAQHKWRLMYINTAFHRAY